MAQNYDLWWYKFSSKALDIIWDRSHYFKEKYWRFDVTVFDWLPDELLDRIINEVEEESCECCQMCAKHRYQVWTDWWWIEHFCIPCYIKIWIKGKCKRFIWYVNKLWHQTISLKGSTQ